MLSSVILLGPQRHVRIVRAAIETLVPEHRSGPIAAVTAGWEEREAEDQELRQHVARPFVNLGVWARVERIFEQDQELLAAMRQRHDTLRSLQELYRLRLSGLMDATHELFRRVGDENLLAPERELWKAYVTGGGIPNCSHRHEPLLGEFSTMCVQIGMTLLTERMTNCYPGDYSILAVFKK